MCSRFSVTSYGMLQVSLTHSIQLNLCAESKLRISAIVVSYPP